MPVRFDRRVFSEDDLRTEAGDRIFQRGEDHVRYVHGLRVSDGVARAAIQTKRVYQVELGWTDGLSGSCTCPYDAFCKHLVAVGLAVLDERSGPPPDDIDALLDRLDAPALRGLVRELAERDLAVARLVALRTSDTSGTAGPLMEAVRDVVSPRGFVDYRRSFDVARDAEDLLDELERHLDAGAADAVRPALLRAVTGLRELAGNADDSAGVLGSAAQRAADLHARSCREGRPDPTALARWLVDFRASSPGWPHTPLDAYVDAFDDDALAEYVAGVERLGERASDEWKRREVDEMLLELADHRGDVDAAIALLVGGPHRRYGAVIERLRAAGRHDEVLGWMDRAVADGRVSNRLGAQGRDLWLDPNEVAAARLAAGREDDALEVLRTQFRQEPSAESFAALVRFADRLGRHDAEREGALTTARAAASGYAEGAVLVEIALSEGDLAAAWNAAQQYGAGFRWRDLAAAGAGAMPRESADLYRPWLEDELRYPGTKKYGPIADTLALMRNLYRRAGAEADFDEYVADVRSRFGRRPSLMKALAQRGL